MYDEAFYADAAARIPEHAFYVLRRLPTGLPLEADRHKATGAEVAAVNVSFTPGDATMYGILIVRISPKVAAVSVTNMGLAFKVPFCQGAYVSPKYLMGQRASGRLLPATSEAVAAVVNAAIRACYPDPILDEDTYDVRWPIVTDRWNSPPILPGHLD